MQHSKQYYIDALWIEFCRFYGFTEKHIKDIYEHARAESECNTDAFEIAQERLRAESEKMNK